MYTITNNSAAPRIIYDVNNRPRSIPARGSLLVDITDKQASRFNRSASLELKSEDGKDPPAPTPRPKNVRRGPPGARLPRVTQNVQINEEAPSEPLTRTQQAAKIQADYAIHKDYPTAMEQSKALLGDDWPGGTPKKSRLFELLNQVQD